MKIDNIKLILILNTYYVLGEVCLKYVTYLKSLIIFNNSIISSLLMMRKLRHREIKKCAQGYIAEVASHA